MTAGPPDMRQTLFTCERYLSWFGSGRAWTLSKGFSAWSDNRLEHPNMLREKLGLQLVGDQSRHDLTPLHF
jgi:hypothetical protein